MANLITAQEVIELAFSENSNMREESIPKTTIGVAEIKYIRPAFGAMYALLADKYADFTNEYVKPALAYFVKCEMMSSIAIDMSNSGVAVSNPQYQSAATDKQRQRLYDSEMGKAKTLLDYALSYIAVHSEEFPDYSGSIGKKSYRVGGILLGNERVATSIMGEAFKEEYERYLREMQEINEVVVDATEEVSKALIATNEAIENTEKAVEEANTATANANDATDKAEKTIEAAEEATTRAEESANRANIAAENAEKVGEDIQRVEKDIQDIKENAVKPEDYYPKMSVGFADNLIGRGEATAEEFTYRASAGMGRSITDDTARVKKIKGNSVVWNQLCDFANDNFYFGSGSGVKDADGYTITISDWSNKTIFQFSKPIQFNSHIWLALATVESPIQVTIKGMPTQGFVANTKCTIYAIYKSSNNNWYWGLAALSEGATAKIKVYGYELYDLTKMFGAGNEPTTVEEFYTRIPSNIDINAYNKGEIISVNTEAIKTVGFNQWDEQWELGYIKGDGTNGGYVANYIRSKNHIPVIGGMHYFINRPANTSDCQIFCYDKSKNLISQYQGAKAYPTQIPLNAAFVRFYMNYGSEVYHNDICINLSHTGIENGKYKPYTPFTRELPIIKKYFPNGMRSAGTAFDSIEWDSTKQKWVAVQRIGSVDAGTLYWEYFESIYNKQGGFMVLNFPKMALQNLKSEIPNLTCTSYPNRALLDALSIPLDKIITGASNNPTRLIIYDSTYSDNTTFLSAMQGVMLYYELAEPIVTEIEEENINFDYYVEDFGTEEALSNVPSAPFRADVVYTFNAVDTIRNNYLEIEEMKKQMAQMQNAISAMQTAQVKVEE